MDEVRLELVAEVRRRIAEGYYDVEVVVEAAVRSFLEAEGSE